MMKMIYSAIILLGGKSTRFGGSLNKVYQLVNNKPIASYSIDLFLADKDCKEVIVVYNKEDSDIINNILTNYPNVLKTIGGNKRHLSVLEGLKLATSDYVLVHDGARPNITQLMIDSLKKELENCDAVSLATAVTDTIKKVTVNTFETINRNDLYAVQTPQGSKRDLLLNALLKVKDDDEITDDLMAIEKYSSVVPKIVLGSKLNIKITTEEDYEYIKFIMGDKDV